jgi:hypothetical protein
MTPKWIRIFSGLTRQSLEHLARTTVAAMLSLYLANLFKLPESYWAAITSLIVMQSTLGDTLTVSGQRFAGTAMGAAAGALLSRQFGPNPLVFGAGVFTLGGSAYSCILVEPPPHLPASRSHLWCLWCLWGAQSPGWLSQFTVSLRSHWESWWRWR